VVSLTGYGWCMVSVMCGGADVILVAIQPFRGVVGRCCGDGSAGLAQVAVVVGYAAVACCRRRWRWSARPLMHRA
jgi:hypothetical protein